MPSPVMPTDVEPPSCLCHGDLQGYLRATQAAVLLRTSSTRRTAPGPESLASPIATAAVSPAGCCVVTSGLLGSHARTSVCGRQATSWRLRSLPLDATAAAERRIAEICRRSMCRRTTSRGLATFGAGDLSNVVEAYSGGKRSTKSPNPRIHHTNRSESLTVALTMTCHRSCLAF